MTIAQETRAEILNRAGKESYGVIASALGLTRNEVAGVIFRARHGTKKVTLAGRHGPGEFAPIQMRPTNLTALMTFKLPPELKADAVARAKSDGVSVAEFIRRAIASSVQQARASDHQL